MHPDAAAFEACIKAHPHDLTPRLVYADWCEDHGDDEFAAALRRPEFYGIVGWCVRSGWGLRIAWTLERQVREAHAALGRIGLVALERMKAAMRSPPAFAAGHFDAAAIEKCHSEVPSGGPPRPGGASA